MGWVKNKRDGVFDVYVYSPAKKRNIYVGRRPPGPGRDPEKAARELFYAKSAEISGDEAKQTTCGTYAVEWLAEHHGPGTKRPARSTRQHNEQMLRAFIRDFGDRRLDGGITRNEALRWSSVTRTTRRSRPRSPTP